MSNVHGRRSAESRSRDGTSWTVPRLKSMIWTYSHDTVTDQKGQFIQFSVTDKEVIVSVSSVAESKGLPIRVSLFVVTYREGLRIHASVSVNGQGRTLLTLT